MRGFSNSVIRKEWLFPPLSLVWSIPWYSNLQPPDVILRSASTGNSVWHTRLLTLFSATFLWFLLSWWALWILLDSFLHLLWQNKIFDFRNRYSNISSNILEKNCSLQQKVWKVQSGYHILTKNWFLLRTVSNTSSARFLEALYATCNSYLHCVSHNHNYLSNHVPYHTDLTFHVFKKMIKLWLIRLPLLLLSAYMELNLALLKWGSFKTGAVTNRFSNNVWFAQGNQV